MARAGRPLGLHHIVAWINLGWAVWALLGGVWFVSARDTIGRDTAWKVFGDTLHGYSVVGVSLLVCGIASLIGVCVKSLGRFAALLCAAWCLATAVVLQLATPQFDQGDIDAWLLLICAFTSVMRWALLVLEPYVDRH